MGCSLKANLQISSLIVSLDENQNKPGSLVLTQRLAVIQVSGLLAPGLCTAEDDEKMLSNTYLSDPVTFSLHTLSLTQSNHQKKKDQKPSMPGELLLMHLGSQAR